MADSGLVEGGFCLVFFFGGSLEVVVVDENVNGAASGFRIDSVGNLVVPLEVNTGSSDGDENAPGGPDVLGSIVDGTGAVIGGTVGTENSGTAEGEDSILSLFEG